MIVCSFPVISGCSAAPKVRRIQWARGFLVEIRGYADISKYFFLSFPAAPKKKKKKSLFHEAAYK